MTKALTSAPHFSLVLKHYSPPPQAVTQTHKASLLSHLLFICFPKTHFANNLISLRTHQLISPALPKYEDSTFILL